MSRSIGLLVVCAVSLASWLPARAMTVKTNIDALRTAIDPSKGPPIAEPVYPRRNSAPEHGPPGPYTPEKAVESGLGGIAVIQCGLALSGRLNRCALVAEGPLDFDFGAAALKMAGVGYLTARAPATFNDGDPVRVIVVFPKPKG